MAVAMELSDHKSRLLLIFLPSTSSLLFVVSWSCSAVGVSLRLVGPPETHALAFNRLIQI